MSKFVKKKNTLVKVKLVIVYVLVTVLLIMITAISQRAKYEKELAALKAIHDEETVALRVELQYEYEVKLSEMERYYEYGGDVDQIDREAEHIAKVLYGMARNHTDSDKRAVVWCILNRVEHYAYPDAIAEVCEQPKQWIGYYSENPVLTDLYDLALEELKIWYNEGHRPLSNEYIYLTWSSKEILLRDTFEENKNTRYWRMN